MNEEIPISVKELKCKRCGHEWIKRIENQPKYCPRCKSPYWNIERGQKRGRKCKKKHEA